MLAQISSIENAAKNTVQVEFLLPKAINFLPGQSFRVTLLQLRAGRAGEDNRFFSIANSPSKNKVLSTIMRVRPTRFKKTIAQLPLGTDVEISNIGGVFLLPEDIQKPLIFIAGGVGVTPFLSMLEYIAEKKLAYQITLLYSNQNQESTVFLDKLKKMEAVLPNFQIVFTMTRDPQWRGERGRIDVDFIQRHVSDWKNRNFMICGSPDMTNSLFGQLTDNGINPKSVLTEEFTGY